MSVAAASERPLQRRGLSGVRRGAAPVSATPASGACRCPVGQRGAALPALALLVAGAAWSLLLGLESSAPRAREAARTAAALAAAKAALLGYAAAYPDRYAGVQGPGRLPCPDTDGNGSPDPPCGRLADAAPRLGWLPEVFLGLGGLRDGAGQRLWYALSPAFRNNPSTRPLNSETPGAIEVDGRGEVVAVLLAPGEPLGPPPQPGRLPEPAECLEGENADGDGRYAGAEGNDRLLAIGRRELMAGVERRVLGEVQAIFGRFGGLGAGALGGAGAEVNCHPPDRPCLPWLAPWRPPLGELSGPARPGVFDSRVGQRHGLLPVHLPRGWFADPSVGVDWSFPLDGGARLSLVGAKAPEEACVREVDCAPGPSLFADGSRRESAAAPAPLDTQLDCRWAGRTALECSGTAVRRDAGLYYPPGSSAGAPFERHYALRLEAAGASAVAVSAAHARDGRTRSLLAQGAVPARVRLRVHDLLPDGTGAGDHLQLDFQGELGANSLRVEGLRYDLDPAPEGGEVPPWFIEDGWHRLVFAAYAAPQAPGGQGQCLAGAQAPERRCLRLRRGAAELASLPAVALLAGAALPGQRRWEGAGIEAWFEGANAPAPAVLERPYGDDLYLDGPPAEGFEDRARGLASP